MRPFAGCSILILSFFLLGCPSTKEIKTEKEPATPKKPAQPDISILVGSLDIAKLKKKIERSDIERLTAMVKREKVDILAMEGIARYPGLNTRIDIVNEFVNQSGMRQTFGENITVNGRQSGNAIFSNYPIQSNTNTPYSAIQSTDFETALQAIIDCGVRELVVISTHLPASPAGDRTVCTDQLNAFSELYSNYPIIVTGNLPRMESVTKTAHYTEAFNDAEAPSVWFSANGSLKLINLKNENTPLGTMTLAEFGVFRKPQP